MRGTRRKKNLAAAGGLWATTAVHASSDLPIDSVANPAGPLREFFVFGVKQARACIFAGSFFLVLLLSKHIPLGPLPRYDFILLAALAIQALLLLLRIETLAEAAVLMAFHLLGLGLEWF